MKFLRKNIQSSMICMQLKMSKVLQSIIIVSMIYARTFSIKLILGKMKFPVFSLIILLIFKFPVFSLILNKIFKFPDFSLQGILFSHFPCFPCFSLSVGTLMNVAWWLTHNASNGGPRNHCIEAVCVCICVSVRDDFKVAEHGHIAIQFYWRVDIPQGYVFEKHICYFVWNILFEIFCLKILLGKYFLGNIFWEIFFGNIFCFKIFVREDIKVAEHC